MKKIKKVLTIILSIAFILGITGPAPTFAATDPVLGATATFSIIAQTAITGTGTISGDVGLNSTGAGITGLTGAMVSGTIYSTDGVAPGLAILNPTVQANLSTANGNISGQTSTDSIGPVLDGLVVTPGVHDIGAGRLNGGILTLDGSGIYIFRASSDFISSGSIALTNGARACDVYWQVNTLATINGTSFVGTIIAGTGVHFGNNVALNGRALALGGDVTLLNNTISGPTCAVPDPDPDPATLHVIKTVINNNGGTAIASDFTIDVSGTNVSPSSFSGSAAGVDVTLDAGSYAVTETSLPGYLQSGSSGCSGTIAAGETKTCTMTNDDIANATVIVGIPVVPPLIHVTKIPNPLVLYPEGGMVTYTNKVTNPGIVALSNVHLIDDKCSPVKYVSGDTNSNSKLDITETWTYTCSTNLTKTTVNTVTASGDANGLTARDFAIATVVVTAVPKLPNTGLPPNENDTPWNIIIPAGIFAILTIFYFTQKKQTA
ncbi:hypothetical protein COX94_02015 [Candidatus Nomurabacteria bacterium CG_4_10_14_0_2_um_filter_33_9]|uniref:SpaA-like prealbumin fold domain-containing protein n=1 Tax=Candidatus Nomurabacteria bacterium CG_4_10_14_0_2_um_filter_33_9 TaxID=1974728 RepID=A0A2J0MFK6_9BACT|nr:MAG: hypothetical protein COX94_02015 [Candidatus Nomurabacteria bacterium CG_4_10_14_0_2_um_filter_33_9]